VNTGRLGNPNLFRSGDDKVINNLNVRVVSLLGGKTSALNKTMQAIMKVVVILPVGGHSLDHLTRLDLVTHMGRNHDQDLQLES
jgi:hypothetical protein